MKWDHALAAVREHFELRTALAHAAGRDATARERAAALRLEARQKRDASELLATRGSPAEALQLALQSMARLRDAFAALETVGAAPPPAVAVALARANTRADELASAPSLDNEIAPKHLALAAAVLRAQYPLDAWLGVASLDIKGIVRLRTRRWLRAARGVAVVVAVIALAVTWVRAIGATASSESGPLFTAARAVDGDPSTDWVAGTGEPHWLELRFRGTRSIHTVTLLNGHLVAGRSTKSFRLDVYNHGRAVRSVEGTFLPTPAASVSLDLSGAKGDRVVITISSSYGDGPAISEVSVN